MKRFANAFTGVLSLALVLPFQALAEPPFGRFIEAEAGAARGASEETGLFQKTKDAVVRVFGDQGRGSGFIYDERGLVLTNYHVVLATEHPRVQLDDTLKVLANIVAVDTLADLAVIRINPAGLSPLSPLSLSVLLDSVVVPGERVVAIGFPLNQSRVITSGIVSGVNDDVIISDVSINPGHSGGPLVNYHGIVVGINTFIDQSAELGSGISGTLPVIRARRVIQRADSLFAFQPPPPQNRLPTTPPGAFPIQAIQSALRLPSCFDIERRSVGYTSQSSEPCFDESAYRVRSTGGLLVTIMTPIYEEFLDRKVTQRLSRARGTPNPLAELHEWLKYVGHYKPLVTIDVQPKIGQTVASKTRNILLGMAIYEFEFKGDVEDLVLMRNRVEVTPIERGFVLRPLWFHDDGWTESWDGLYRAEDLAQAGIFQFDPRVFEPVDGRWPLIELKIWDRKRFGRPRHVVITEAAVSRVWKDFLPYYQDAKER